MRRLAFLGSCVTLAFASAATGHPHPTTIASAAAASQSPAALARPEQALGRPTQANAPDPAAVAALRRMSQYLATLQGFELTSDATLDVVTDSGQKLQIDGRSVTRSKSRA